MKILEGDCRETLRTLADNSIDSCLTDPPYHLTNNTGTRSPYPGQYTPIGKPKSPKGGFMGKQWDGGDIAFTADFWSDVFRVLKPGAYLAAFGATRGYHRMACAIEDAGFELRDSLAWMYGTGFPKSHSVGKSLDNRTDEQIAAGVPQPDDSITWASWGTALKPAFEPIVLARKPLSESTVAANVLRWRTGALNIDACRVENLEYDPKAVQRSQTKQDGHTVTLNIPGHSQPTFNSAGRWPANVVHDGSDEVIAAFPITKSGQLLPTHNAKESQNGSMSGKNYAGRIKSEFGGDSGSAARFFYSAKASKADRNGSKHPTIKPIALMQWLARLITPPGGSVLDPFAGSGTTGAACALEGFNCVMCEREAEYVADIRRRSAPAFPWTPKIPFPWNTP